MGDMVWGGSSDNENRSYLIGIGILSGVENNVNNCHIDSRIERRFINRDFNATLQISMVATLEEKGHDTVNTMTDQIVFSSVTKSRRWYLCPNRPLRVFRFFHIQIFVPVFDPCFQGSLSENNAL